MSNFSTTPKDHTDHATVIQRERNHRHQHQQEKDEGACPVSRIWAACASVLTASWFLLASAASLFTSARWPTAASLFASLSCSRARFRSILACTQSHRTGSQGASVRFCKLSVSFSSAVFEHGILHARIHHEPKDSVLPLPTRKHWSLEE